MRLLPLGRFSGSLGQKVYQTLRHGILSLAYNPGEILRKPDICAALGVSRSPVADAVARLQVEGLVDVVPQAGTFVARFSMQEIREGAFLREAIEVGRRKTHRAKNADVTVTLVVGKNHDDVREAFGRGEIRR